MTVLSIVIDVAVIALMEREYADMCILRGYVGDGIRGYVVRDSKLASPRPCYLNT